MFLSTVVSRKSRGPVRGGAVCTPNVLYCIALDGALLSSVT